MLCVSQCEAGARPVGTVVIGLGIPVTHPCLSSEGTEAG